MSRAFDGVDDVLKVSVPTSMNVGYGTFAAIIRVDSAFSGTRAWMRLVTNTPTNVLGVFFNASGQVGMSNGASAPAGSTSLVASEWYVVACGKATGTTTPRVHLYRYSTASWTHENTGGTAANATVPGTTGTLAIAARNADQFTPCTLVVAGFWASNLSDGDVETLAFDLSAWEALSPAGLWALNQAATTDPVNDLTANGADQTSLTGTTVSSDIPSGWSYGSEERTLDGSLPAASGTLARQLAAYRAATGSQPASTGTLARVLAALRALSGSHPASTGTLARVYQAVRSLAGDHPASSGTLARLLGALRTVAGDQPTATGTLARTAGAFARVLEGASPAATGVLEAASDLINRTLSGSMPAAEATLTRLYQALRTTSGDQPAASGVLARTAGAFARTLAGAAAESTGALTRTLGALRSLAGSQPTATGTLSALSTILRSLAGSLPAASGALSQRLSALRSLSGDLPSATAILARTAGSFSRAVTGILGAVSGALAALGGVLPDARGTATLTETQPHTATLAEVSRHTATLADTGLHTCTLAEAA